MTYPNPTQICALKQSTSSNQCSRSTLYLHHSNLRAHVFLISPPIITQLLPPSPHRTPVPSDPEFPRTISEPTRCSWRSRSLTSSAPPLVPQHHAGSRPSSLPSQHLDLDLCRRLRRLVVGRGARQCKPPLHRLLQNPGTLASKRFDAQNHRRRRTADRRCTVPPPPFSTTALQTLPWWWTRHPRVSPPGQAT